MNSNLLCLILSTLIIYILLLFFCNNGTLCSLNLLKLFKQEMFNALLLLTIFTITSKYYLHALQLIPLSV